MKLSTKVFIIGTIAVAVNYGAGIYCLVEMKLPLLGLLNLCCAAAGACILGAWTGMTKKL